MLLVQDAVFPSSFSSISAPARCLWPIKSAPSMRFTGRAFRLGLRGTCFISPCPALLRAWSCGHRHRCKDWHADSATEDVSQVLMCYSPRVSLQPTTPNVIEWHHDSPGLALSSSSTWII